MKASFINSITKDYFHCISHIVTNSSPLCLFSGFEDLQSLVLLSDEQISDLSSAINMKLGHKLKFAVIIREAREEKEEQERKRKREKDERERTQRREEEERKREEEEQRRREKEEQELAHELSKIEREGILAKARSTRDAEDQKHAGANPTATKSSEQNAATEQAQHQITHLPDWKDYASFISHKKTHTQFADSSETLSIRLKVPALSARSPTLTSLLCLARIC
jgi:hypothetical protein